VKKNQDNESVGPSLEEILKVCRKHNVLSYEDDKLRIVFGSQTKEKPLTPSARQTKANETQTQAVEKEALEKESFNDDEDEIATMQIENPALYERLMIERELEDAKPAAAITGIETT